MKAFINNQVIELNEEQIEQLKNIQTSQRITDKQRISAIEKAVSDLAIMLVGGISND